MNLIIDMVIQDTIAEEKKLGQYARKEIPLEDFIKTAWNKALMLYEEGMKTNQLLVTDSHWLSVARQREFFEEIHKIRSKLTVSV